MTVTFNGIVKAARVMRFEDEGFEMEFLNAPPEQYAICEITYQRNGSSGEGFHVVKIRRVNDGLVLLATVFETSKHVAVIDPWDLTNHWRGDNFEPHLREAVDRFLTEWEASVG